MRKFFFFLLLSLFFSCSLSYFVIVNDADMEFEGSEVSDFYFYSESPFYIYVKNYGNKEAVNLSHSLEGLSIPYSKSTFNPDMIPPGYTGVFKFTLDNITCSDIGSNFTFI